ncbi:MAG TPA: NAD(P)/FAD-dependent oxidoreductase [Roseiflexaceae bacterium]|nr:NAD(P)/FAD-dependent oxidoreductase [Roseiflexaceae bacterium]
MPTRSTSYDAVVIGAGPNGLSAAITLARAGRSVLVAEANDTIGGGARSAELTLPGFIHDSGSAVHPLGVASPFFQTLPLHQHGLRWIHPPLPLAHPFDDGTAAALQRSIRATGATLGPDAQMYWRLMAPVVRNWDRIAPAFLGPLRFPRHPVAFARFGLRAPWPASMMARALFRGTHARGLFAGNSAHSFLPLERMPSAAFGMMLCALGHVVGWPIPQGGAQAISNALASYLRSLGGEIVTDWRVDSLDELPHARAVLCDLTPRQLLRIAGRKLPESYQHALQRYRYGPGVFKLDYALDGPIPWTNEDCCRAGTVHLGGTLEEIAASERAPWQNAHAERPFVLLSQPTLFDPTRAPEGKHIAWAYCHVPNGSTFDMTERIESQIERFAPGFRSRIIARSVSSPARLEQQDANLIGGDINGGVQDLFQLFTRPTWSLTSYRTAATGLYICSSSTPPGGGVHGMGGFHAAQTALRDGL